MPTRDPVKRAAANRRYYERHTADREEDQAARQHQADFGF